MLKKFNYIKRDELVRGSFILFTMLLFYNILNYVFQISMARMLGPADYSILAALMSIIYVFSIPNEAIQTVVSTLTSRLNTKNKLGMIKDLLIRSLSKGTALALVLFIVFIPVAIFLSNFLSISISLLIITGLFIFNVFTFSVTRGILQGSKKFKALGSNLIIESFLKVVFSIILVTIGWKVYGAIFGVILGWIISFILSFYLIKTITKAKRKKEDFGNIYSNNLPVLIAMTSVVLMYSLDIIFARRFFSPFNAGEFAFVSLIGKVIFFVSMAIGKALLPISTEGFTKGKETSKLFKKSVFLVTCISLIALLLYYSYPEQIIKLISLGSNQYLGASHLLFEVGLAYAFLSISNIIILYRISINKISKEAYSLLIFPIIQIILFFIYNNNLSEFTLALLISNTLLFLYTLFLAKNNHLTAKTE